MAKKKTVETQIVRESPIERTGLMVWDACAGAGAPVCLAGRGDGGLSVNAYHQDGRIVGVNVYDEDRLIGATGLIPADVLKQELALTT